MALQKNNHAIVWSAFIAGEEKAFEQLFFSFYDFLFGYGIKLIGDEEFVKDTIQDFFLHLYEKRLNLAAQVDRPLSYLLISFRRRLLTEKSKRQLRFESLEANGQSLSRLFAIGADEIIINEESDVRKKRMVLSLLNQLPPRQREIIYLKYYCDFEIQEIADAFSISYQVVANHLYRGIKKLRVEEKSKAFVLSEFLGLFVF